MTNLITEARELCEKATPGPWFNFGDWMIHTEHDVEQSGIAPEKVVGTVKAENAAFIARSRTLIPELCNALEKAEQESGCEWCKTPSHNPDIGGCTLVFYRSKTHPIGAYAISVSVFDEYGEEQEPVLVRIDNCIHCGKRLEEHHEAD